MLDVAAHAVNIDSPGVTHDAPYTSFIWEYIERSNSHSNRVKVVSLVLDASGELWVLGMS
jgi:hypothetical protein